MAKRVRQESGEERVTAKTKLMMNLTARMPSVVSSSTSSNPNAKFIVNIYIYIYIYIGNSQRSLLSPTGCVKSTSPDTENHDQKWLRKIV